MQFIPDRTKIFLAAFWLWTWILLQFNRICSALLHGLLIWAPDSYIPDIRHIKQKSPIRVVRALDQTGNTITNKLNLFLNLRWDNELCDNKGGVDIDDFARYLGTSVIWAAYLLEYELSPIYNDFIHSTKSKSFSTKDFDKLFKAIVIDLSNKLIYKLGTAEKEHILFGEVNFH